MTKPLFRGICASSVTPFNEDGEPELDRLPAHIDWLLQEGADAISPLGSSGEFCALEIDARKRVLDAALDACNGRVQVVAGTHHYSTRHTIDLSKHAEMAGADALLVVPPYYMAPTPSQTMDHFRRLAEAVSIPIVLYHNIPLTAIDLKARHLLALYEEKAIAAVKMSNPEPDRICQLLQATDNEFPIYAGLDTVAFEGLCHGAHGWISGIPSIVPRVARDLYDAIALESDLPRARKIWNRLAPLMRMQFAGFLERREGTHWFSVMKAVLNMIGPPVGNPLPPISPLSEAATAQLKQILRQLGYVPQQIDPGVAMA